MEPPDRASPAPLYRCLTKATDKETGEPRRSAAWIAARRAQFLVFDDHIRCGNWVILATEVEEAILYQAREFLLTTPILQVRTTERTYQFGFNPWTRVAEYLPFAFEKRKVRLGLSPFSLVLRLILLAYFSYWLWQEYGS